MGIINEIQARTMHDRVRLTYLRSSAGYGGAVADLVLVIVTPGKHLAVTGAGHAVKRPAGKVYHLTVDQKTQDPLWGSLVGVVIVPQPVELSLTPRTMYNISLSCC